MRSVLIMVICLLLLTGCSKPVSYSNQDASVEVVELNEASETGGGSQGDSPESSIEYDSVSIIESTTYQQMDGFGASAAWWAQAVGAWSENAKGEVLDLLFDSEKGIGLNILRYNIGGGKVTYIQDPWRSAASLQVDPGVFDISGDAEAISIVKGAVDRGVDTVVAFANTPPPELSVSGKVTGADDGSSNLPEENYEAFADYLIGASKALRQEGIPVAYVSPVNEPQWNWKESNGQEGCHYSPEEAVAMAKALDDRITELEADFKVSVIEAGEWGDAMDYAELLFDMELVNMDHFAAHSYWSGASQKKMFMREFKQLDQNYKLWMTEWTEMNSGRDYGMDSAMIMANTIYEDLTLLNVSSWQYWIAVSKYDYRDGLIYTNGSSETYETTKRLYALGQFSKYILKGSYRNNVDGNVKLVDYCSFTDDSSGTTTIIFINRDDEVKNIKISTEHDYSKTQIIRTDENDSMAEQYNDLFTDKVTLSPKSITTVVFRR